MTAAMADAGADAAVVVTPCYFKGRMNAAALARHYEAVADASPVPIVLYSVPANTGIDLPPEVAALLADHPNVVGIKDSGGDIAKIGMMAQLTRGKDFQASCPPKLATSSATDCSVLQILAGSASFLLSALHVGAVGGICALANAMPKAVWQLFDLFSKGEFAAASELQKRLVAPNQGCGFSVAKINCPIQFIGTFFSRMSNRF